VAETGAIVEYLGSVYGGKEHIPERGTAEYREYVYWMYYAEGSLMPFLIMNFVLARVKEAPMPFFIRPIAAKIVGAVMNSYVNPNISINLEFIEAHLEGKTWFVGDHWTGVDVQMIFPLEAMAKKSGMLDKYPNINAYVSRVHALECYKKALEIGGPYDYA